jgi:hypothetical protein
VVKLYSSLGFGVFSPGRIGAGLSVNQRRQRQRIYSPSPLTTRAWRNCLWVVEARHGLVKQLSRKATDSEVHEHRSPVRYEIGPSCVTKDFHELEDPRRMNRIDERVTTMALSIGPKLTGHPVICVLTI